MIADLQWWPIYGVVLPAAMVLLGSVIWKYRFAKRRPAPQQMEPTVILRLVFSAVFFFFGLLLSLPTLNGDWFLPAILSGAGTVFAFASFVVESKRPNGHSFLVGLLAGLLTVLNFGVFWFDVYPGLPYLKPYFCF